MFDDVRFIDLSQEIDENTPVWPGAAKFSKKIVMDYDQGFRVMRYEGPAGLGTHVDAPAHRIQDGRTIDQLTLQELILPAFVIDVREQVKTNSDYVIQAQDIFDWEDTNGSIPKESLVLLLTGWSLYWQDGKKYSGGEDAKSLHFPSLSDDAANLLAARHVRGVGIDTLSFDVGGDRQFKAHDILLGADIYQVENLTNLDQLPPVGSIAFVMPIRYKGGTESTARVIAVIAANSKSEIKKDVSKGGEKNQHEDNT